MISNAEISDIFSLYAKLLDINGVDSFKAKSYSNASFQIDRLATPLTEMDAKTIASQRGIGQSIMGKVVEIINTNQFIALQELLEQTPEGVLDMMKIKGLGAKKIHTIWKEMEIESLGELLYACNENRLTLYKGFGAKTQQNVLDAIVFLLKQKGKVLYQQAEILAEEWLKFFTEKMPSNTSIAITGGIRSGNDVIEKVELVVAATIETVSKVLLSADIEFEIAPDNLCIIINNGDLQTKVYIADSANFGSNLFMHSGSQAFIEAFEHEFPVVAGKTFATEDEIFELAQIASIPAYLRSSAAYIPAAKNNSLPICISVEDIKGIIHTHSTYSDGRNTIAEMAEEAINKNFEYLVISDHSKAAFYANGLSIERIIEQHTEIDKLNKTYDKFKLFKSIECDILNDGSLDYDEEVLASFDLVIASIHSNLRMDEEKAMSRLIKAVENPFTTILGHPTGRLLLSRNGYPINHKILIDACVANGVVIEINAHPRRLDLDWTWIPYALEKGALLSINPDAHWAHAFADIKYGVLAARKGGLTAANNLSSYTLAQFEAYLLQNK